MEEKKCEFIEDKRCKFLPLNCFILGQTGPTGPTGATGPADQMLIQYHVFVQIK